MSIHPVGLERLGQEGLLIRWSDGRRRQYRASELRDQCPCATCREIHAAADKRPATELPVLSLDEAQPLSIASMKPVGNYAYSIAFSDGHDTGIYTFEGLLELGTEA
jgi:DUF971 family protein